MQSTLSAHVAHSVMDRVLIAAGTGDEVSASVDMEAHEGLFLIFDLEDINTSGTAQLTLEDSDDDSTFATVTDEDGNNVAQGAGAMAADGLYYFDFHRQYLRRYVRARVTVAGAGIDFILHAVRYNHQYPSAMTLASGTAGALQLRLPARA